MKQVIGDIYNALKQRAMLDEVSEQLTEGFQLALIFYLAIF